MVIFSHILSRTSRPDSGQAIALATVAMSVWMERWKSSNPEEEEEREIRGCAEMLPNRSSSFKCKGTSSKDKEIKAHLKIKTINQLL